MTVEQELSSNEVQRTRVAPSVWELPDQGIQWCDCGKDHPLTLEYVRSLADELGIGESDEISHPEVVELTMEVWGYVEVCRFFHLALNAAAEHVHGSVAAQYPVDTAFDIIGYFSKTWQGCPVEACEGGYSSSDVPSPEEL